MAFCPYCGKQLNDGEVCSCAMAGTASAPVKTPDAAQPPVARPVSAPQPAAPQPVSPAPQAAQPASAPVRPAVPTAPSAPSAAPSAQGAPAPAAYPTPAPQSVPDPRQSYGYAPAAGTQPAAGYDPAQGMPQSYGAPQNYGAPQGYGAPQNYSAPQSYGPTPGYTAPTAPAKKSSTFVTDIVNPLLDRVKMLVSPEANEAVARSIKTTDMSWMLVYGAYILFGTLAACFALPKFIDGIIGDLSAYGELLGELFGSIFWRGLLINILTIAISVGAVIAVCGVTKTKLPFARALNFVGIAFVPAVAFNVLGFLFSFFFPTGTILCGLLSSVCTIAIICWGLSSICEKKNLWLYAITASAIMLVYLLVVYIFMDSMISDITETVINYLTSSIFGDFGSIFG